MALVAVGDANAGGLVGSTLGCAGGPEAQMAAIGFLLGECLAGGV
jgi:hypothetical protein